MNNQDDFGQVKFTINWAYVMALEDKLKSVQDDKDTVWNDHDIRRLVQRIRMLKKHLTKKTN